MINKEDIAAMENETSEKPVGKKRGNGKGVLSGLDNKLKTKKINKSYMMQQKHIDMMKILQERHLPYDSYSEIVGYSIECLYKTYIKNK